MISRRSQTGIDLYVRTRHLRNVLARLRRAAVGIERSWQLGSFHTSRNVERHLRGNRQIARSEELPLPLALLRAERSGRDRHSLIDRFPDVEDEQGRFIGFRRRRAECEKSDRDYLAGAPT